MNQLMYGILSFSLPTGRVGGWADNATPYSALGIFLDFASQLEA